MTHPPLPLSLPGAPPSSWASKRRSTLRLPMKVMQRSDAGRQFCLVAVRRRGEHDAPIHVWRPRNRDRLSISDPPLVMRYPFSPTLFGFRCATPQLLRLAFPSA